MKPLPELTALLLVWFMSVLTPLWADAPTSGNPNPSVQVATLAGKAGQAGSSDGAGGVARFNNPFGVTVDAGGNLYVADTNNETLRKITPDGVVTTLAGSAGKRGGDDGAGGAARFNNPGGVAVDAGGNIYVADTNNETIRKVTKDGVVSTLAGSVGNPGSSDGAGNAARFRNPSAVAVDGRGNIYVADLLNDTIRKITPDGMVTTLAGSAGQEGGNDGAGSAARFKWPTSVALDGNGNLYVADTANHTIRKIAPDGVVTTLAGLAGNAGSVDGAGNAARFKQPDALAVDANGTVYVADTFNQTIRKITPDGVVTTLAGSAGTTGGADGPGGAARFNSPVGLALDGGGHLYVADDGNHAIRQIALGVASPVAAAGVPAQIKNVPLKMEHADAVFCVAYSPDGKKLASASKDNTVKLWDAATGQCTATLRGQNNAVMSVSWSPDGRTVAGGGIDGAIKLWDVATGQAGKTLTGHTDFIWCVSFSPNGRMLASGSTDKTVKLWDLATGQCATTLLGHAGSVTGVAWSPDGRTLASGSSDNSLKLWDVATGKCAATFTGHTDEITSVGFSPDGRMLASGSRDNSIKVWNVATGKCLATLTGHTGPVYQVSFSPNGKTLASGSADRTIKLWDMTNGQCAATFTGPTGAVSSVSWSPDGTTLASGSRDNSIKLWPVKPSDLVANPATSALALNAVATPSPTPKPTPTPKPRPVGGDATYTFTTLAGTPSTSDGPGGAARFRYPSGVAVDAGGNVYVADSVNFTIRKITPAGVVTTLAGSPYHSSFSDGVGNAAGFGFPQGVAVDASGNVYVADFQFNNIRKITPDGVVTSLAAAGPGGSSDGTGGGAQFRQPMGVAVDGRGNVYVADSGNNTIRKLTPDLVATTLAGTAGKAGHSDGVGGAASFNNPQGVAVDKNGNVYVADTKNMTIRKITPGGVVTTLAGSAGNIGKSDGPGGAARFHNPQEVAVDGSGNLYVTDVGNETIRKITPEGMVTTLAGQARPAGDGSSDGAGSAAQFDHPIGVAVDSRGNVYVADNSSDTIRKITPAGVVSTLAGRPRGSDGAGGAASFSEPSDVAVDGSGNVYVADANNDTIRKITPDGVVTTLAGSAGQSGSDDGPGGAARLNSPGGVALDAGGNVYVADAYNYTIRKITKDGVVSTLAGLAKNPGSNDGTGSAARFNFAFGGHGLAADGSGNLYVADNGNDTIRKITPSGVVTTVAGSAGQSGSDDGPGSAARFNQPWGVAVDGKGNLYVADNKNSTVRMITPGGVVTTVAGNPNNVGNLDGPIETAQFANPRGIVVDGSGNLFVVDDLGCTIRRITPDGMVTTVAGSAGDEGSHDGPGSAARIFLAEGIALDAAGNLYVADSANGTIRKGTPDGAVMPKANSPPPVKP